MAKGKKNPDALYRCEKFEIFPNNRQLEILCAISSSLTATYNRAWQECQEAYDQYIKPVYNRIIQAREDDQSAGYGKLWEEECLRKHPASLAKEEFPAYRIERQRSLLAEKKQLFADHWPTLFDQINSLTGMDDDSGANRNWHEETLDSLHGAYKSHINLKKKGDRDARPPGKRTEAFFYKIPGRSGWSERAIRQGTVILAREKFEDTLSFPIPPYQQSRLSRTRVIQKVIKTKKGEKMKEALAIKKFELYRDERDMAKPGRFWISIAYEISKPAEKKLDSGRTVYIALGASRMGIVCAKGEFCWNLPRPDFRWKPEIDAVHLRTRQPYRQGQQCVKKGGKKWRRRMEAFHRMNAIMARQQKQHGQYEVVKRLMELSDELIGRLLELGNHFVVTDLKIRSKEGALADSSRKERGGAPTGANWSAQNTGNIANLVAKLEEKAKERGGCVRRRNAPFLEPHERKLPQDRRKILIARKLREEFLAQKQ